MPVVALFLWGDWMKCEKCGGKASFIKTTQYRKGGGTQVLKTPLCFRHSGLTKKELLKMQKDEAEKYKKVNQ
jgi:hypothetical protein